MEIAFTIEASQINMFAVVSVLTLVLGQMKIIFD